MYIVVVSRERYVYCVKVAAAARSDCGLEPWQIRWANVSLEHHRLVRLLVSSMKLLVLVLSAAAGLAAHLEPRASSPRAEKRLVRHQ